MIAQRTIRMRVEATGVGLHTGVPVRLTLKPAPENTGIFIRRTDIAAAQPFRIAPELVVDTRLCSALECNGFRVATVEHLMSALAGLGIDNLHIELDGPEVPILDGSAAPFVYLLQSAGFEQQRAPKRFIQVLQDVRVEEGEKWAAFSPHEGAMLSFRIDFDHPVFHKAAREITIDFGKQSYVQEVSRARTFGFVKDVEYLRSHGLALGGNLDNAVVLDEYRVLNSDGLRYADEFVKHKVLDAVGDLYLTGFAILGHFTAYKSGHGLNNKLLRTLMAATHAWQWREYADESIAPRSIRQQYSLPPRLY